MIIIRAHCTQRSDWEEGELTSDWETTESPLLLQSPGFSDSCGWGNDDWVEDEAVLVALDLANHLGLVVGGAVVVDDTETSEESHVDGHVVLGDSVHRRGQEWGLEGDALGDWGVEVDSAGWEAYGLCEQAVRRDAPDSACCIPM